jgi:uncharacterized membrane protein (DUF4010 family)
VSPDPNWETFLGLGVALAIGFALGLQRERVHAKDGVRASGGVRTFSVLALLGATAALLPGSPWPVVAALVAATALLLVAYLRSPPQSVGLTTEALALLTVALGALSASGARGVAAVVGGVALILASQKGRLHGFAGRLTEEDETATVKFVALALIVFPFLPDRPFGPYDALNPYEIGLMVLLVAGISFVGYVLVKTMGPGRGLLLTGALGGLASSTATTVSFARRSRETPDLAPVLATATVVACSVLFPRVLLLVGLASPAFLPAVWPWLGAMALVAAIAATFGIVTLSRAKQVDVRIRNPFELGPALWFALLYAVVVFGARAVLAELGEKALYVVGAAGGVADVDAASLTAARLHASGNEVATAVLVRVVVLATAVNSLVKAGIALALGSPAYARRTVPALVATALAGGLAFVMAP